MSGTPELGGEHDVCGVSRERDVGVLTELDHLAIRARRVLDVGDLERGERTQHPAGGDQIPARVCVEPDLGVVADRGAHFLHHSQLGIRIRGADLALEHARAVLFLHAGAIARDIYRSSFTWRVLRGEPQGEVLREGDCRPRGPSEERVHRHPERLASNVPERHLDGAERAHEREVVRVAEGPELGHAAPLAGVDVHRIGPDELRYLRGLEHVAVIDVGNLAKADEARRRVDLDDALGGAVVVAD